MIERKTQAAATEQSSSQRSLGESKEAEPTVGGFSN